MNENDVANLLLQDLQFEVGERVCIRANPIGQDAGVWYGGGEAGVISAPSNFFPHVKFDLPNPKMERSFKYNECYVDVHDLLRCWE